MSAPNKFCHVVYRTYRFDEMVSWYQRVFLAQAQYQDAKLAFLTYDDEHHRFAFVNLGAEPSDASAKPASKAGVAHLAYAWESLDSYMDAYKRLRNAGVRPSLPIKHGLTLSMYYDDPDGNALEFQIDLMSSDEANAFMRSDAFQNNPIGEKFDPEALHARYEAGEFVDDLIFRSDQPEAASGRKWRKRSVTPS